MSTLSSRNPTSWFTPAISPMTVLSRGIRHRRTAAPCSGFEPTWFVMAGNRDNRKSLLRHLRRIASLSRTRYGVRPICRRCLRRAPDHRSIRSRTRKQQGPVSARRDGGTWRACWQPTPASRSVLFLHHPPFVVGVGPEPRNFEDWSEVEAFSALMLERSSASIFVGSSAAMCTARSPHLLGGICRTRRFLSSPPICAGIDPKVTLQPAARASPAM